MFEAERLAAWDPSGFFDCLRRAGFTLEALKVAEVDQKPLAPDAPRPYLPEGSRTSILLRLFQWEESVASAAALQVFGGELAGLLEIGLLRADADRALVSEVRLVALKDGWFAADPLHRLRSGEPDYVMGLSPTTRMLAGLTPAWPGARALDLGTGAGWNAFQLAAGGAETTATDINSRAVAIARFNAKLGGLAIDFREGDLFSPVAGETFDVIATNPPFIISPDNTYLFRDHPQGGDFLCREVLRCLPEHLRPGGVGCLLFNWHHETDDDWCKRPLEWVEDLPCHRWLFRSECLSPANYARRWLAHDRPTAGEDPQQKLERWLAHYQKLGAQRFSFGFMFLWHQPGEKPWTRTDARSGVHIAADASSEVLRVLRNESWLAAGRPDAELLTSQFVVPDGIHAEAEMELGQAGWQRRTIRLHSPKRLAYDGQVDENLLRLLELCRAGKTPAMMVAELKSRPEWAGLDLPGRIADLTRGLLRFGLLDPPIAESSSPIREEMAAEC